MNQIKFYIVRNTRLDVDKNKTIIWVVKTQKGADHANAVMKEFAKKSDAIAFFKTLRVHAVALVQDDKARYRYQIITTLDNNDNVSHETIDLKARKLEAEKLASVKKSSTRSKSLYIVVNRTLDANGQKTIKWVLKTPKSVTNEKDKVFEMFDERQSAIDYFKNMKENISAIVQDEKAKYEFKIVPRALDDKTTEIIFDEIKYAKKVKPVEKVIVVEEVKPEPKKVVNEVKPETKAVEEIKLPKDIDNFFDSMKNVDTGHTGSEPTYELNDDSLNEIKDAQAALDYSENLYDRDEGLGESKRGKGSKKMKVVMPKSNFITFLIVLVILAIFIGIVTALALFVVV